jgi:uncharacterized membrane protein YphA (DoxX/SURF4 family)
MPSRDAHARERHDECTERQAHWQRDRSLVDATNHAMEISPHDSVKRRNQWWVPTIEFTARSAVFVGLLAPLAALGLLVIILVASATSERQRIKVYRPIDEADRIDDWLYLPETLYAFMLIMVVSAGAGPYSLDAAIWGLIDKPAVDSV